MGGWVLSMHLRCVYLTSLPIADSINFTNYTEFRETQAMPNHRKLKFPYAWRFFLICLYMGTDCYVLS